MTVSVPQAGTAAAGPARTGAGWKALTLALAAVIIGARVAVLASDPYSRLDWSAGILTDEGFYVHNARNVVLFGHARTDGFNNMLLSPVLHYAQTAVFSVFGTGAVQARAISVVCSLLTLALLYAGLRRSFDARIALTAVAFLGLDHANLLYNRMALMDTPAALPAVAAFYAFVRAEEARGARIATAWRAFCGGLLGLTLVVRLLCSYMVPAPFIAGGVKPRGSAWTAVGMAAVLAVYGLVWYMPNRTEIAPMNAYYRLHQIQPRSFSHLLENVKHAFVGDHRGMSPYLFRHTPVLFGLALFGLVAQVLGRYRRQAAVNPAERYLTGWMVLGAAMLAIISYSPSRYYVTVYPALASVAAITLWRLPPLWEQFACGGWASGGARGLLATFFTFHAALALVHFEDVLSPGMTAVALYGPLPAAGLAAMRWRPSRSGPNRRAVALLLSMWALVNIAWLADWARRLDYSQAEMSRWLGASLPANSVLIGDVAPGLCLDNSFRAIHVQPGLANDVRPVDRFAGSPRYIVILDGHWKERYWFDHFPELVTPNRRIRLARVIRWDIGVYAVDDANTKDH